MIALKWDIEIETKGKSVKLVISEGFFKDNPNITVIKMKRKVVSNGKR
jgi:hypothetical protein